MSLREKRKGAVTIIPVAMAVILMLMLLSTAFGQSAVGRDAVAGPENVGQTRSVFTNYRGIVLGTTADELLAGIESKPTFESVDDYFYIFSEAESAQFILDADRKVKLISITYYGDNPDAPTYADVFGEDVEVKMSPDGNIYNVVTYPDAGHWISYYRAEGAGRIVAVIIQKL